MRSITIGLRALALALISLQTITFLVASTSPHPGTNIRGYVLNASGDPWEVPGALVNLRGNGTDQSTSAVGGEYWFHDISEGHYTLSASAPGYQPFTKTLYVAGWMVVEPYTVLTLAPDGFPISSASGRVIDSHGTPLPNVTVSTDPHGYIEFTDSQGRYHFDYLPSDDWEIDFIATARGYKGNYQRVLIPGGSLVTVPDIVLTEADMGNRIFFTEDFETDLSDWEDIERPRRMYITHDIAHSGSGCLEMEFRGGPDEVQAGWMHHWVYPEREGTPMVYEGTETIYIRWYQRWSSNFLFKGHDLYAISGWVIPAETDHTLYVEVAPENPITEEPSPTGRPLVMIRATTDISHTCGLDHPDYYCPWRVEDVPIERDRWYRFEVLATMNQPYDPTAGQPSQSNGTIRFWLDGVELLNLDGLFMRHGLLAWYSYVLNSYSSVMIGPYYHGGVPGEIDRMYSWIDDLVVANYRLADEYMAPRCGTFEPSGGSGRVSEWADFTTTYSDPNGYDDIRWAFFFLDREPPIVRGGLAAAYYQPADLLLLLGGGFCRPGQAMSLATEYVTLDCGESRVAGEDDRLIINWAVRPERCFDGDCGENRAYEFVMDSTRLWDFGEVGTWTLEPASEPVEPALSVQADRPGERVSPGDTGPAAHPTEADLEWLRKEIEAWQSQLGLSSQHRLRLIQR